MRNHSWTPPAAAFLASALVLGPPVASAGGPQQEQAGARSEGAGLTVATEPASALVYVDGQLRGATPLALSDLTRGDRRVRVVKDGYIENSRIVRVRPRHASRLDVRLTPQRSEGVRLQAEAGRSATKDDKNKGSGGLKWVLIGGSLAAAGAATYVVVTKNSPPLPGTVQASATTALMSVTSVTFTAQGASDPDKDPLTYAWEFGDGGTAAGQTVSRVFDRAGDFSVKLKVSDPKKHVVEAPSITVKVKSLSGAWRGNYFHGPFTMTFTQNATSISGSFSDNDGPGEITSGSASAPGNVTFSIRQQIFIFVYTATFTGTLDSSLDTITGTHTSPTSSFTLRRQ